MGLSLYTSARWRNARRAALRRDSDRCTVARLLGGTCSAAPFHVHHIQPVSGGGDPHGLDNLASVCASHHPVWESLRRSILRARVDPVEDTGPPACPHHHPTSEGRRQCEARRARQRARRDRDRMVAA